MCVIIAKRAGDKIDREYLEHMMIRGASSNRDGCGFALKKAGTDEIIFSKGYRGTKAAEDLIEFLKNYEIEQADEFMFHARIGTSGRRDEYNTHPFVLGEQATEDDSATITLKDLHLKQPCFAHNGVFSEYSDYRSRWNDTFHFGDLFLSQEDVVENLMRLDESSIEVLYKNDFDYNKVSIMFPGRTIMKLIGNFSSNKGLWFSNRMWEYDDYYKNVGGVEYFGPQASLKSIVADMDSCSLPNRSTRLLEAKKEDTNEEGGFNANIELIFEEEEKATPNSGSKSFSWNRYDDEEDDEYYGGLFSKKKEEKEQEKTVFKESPSVYLSIKLNNDNCKELFMIAKNNEFGLEKNKIYEVSLIAQASGFYWINQFKSYGTSILKTEDFLNNNMYFVPRESFRDKYRDYKYLCFSITPSKSKAKAVKKVIEVALKKILKECKLKGLVAVKTDALIEYYNQHLLRFLNNESPIKVAIEEGYPFVD